MSLSPAIARLTPADLDDCVRLAHGRGWHPDRRRWRLVLEVADGYGIRDPAGALAACVMLTRYGSELAAVGMMLVAERWGRRGLGQALMAHALAVAGPATVFLYATPLGRPLYERLGFRSVATVSTARGRFRGPPAGTTRPADRRDRDAILALDATAFGADRSRLLAGQFALAEQLRVLERDGQVCGYAAAEAHADATHVGPAIAPDLVAGRELIADLAAGTDTPVRLDLDCRHPGLREWAEGHGVTAQEDTWLMVHGGRELPGARERVVLPAGLALG